MSKILYATDGEINLKSTLSNKNNQNECAILYYQDGNKLYVVFPSNVREAIMDGDEITISIEGANFKRIDQNNYNNSQYFNLYFPDYKFGQVYSDKGVLELIKCKLFTSEESQENEDIEKLVSESLEKQLVIVSKEDTNGRQK